MSICASVVIATFKRPVLLDRCLKALMAQEFDPAGYEVIIVDDAVCAETRRQIEWWQEQAASGGHAIRYLTWETSMPHAHGPAAARNLGWHAAHGNVIAFTDDDCVPAPGWLQAGIAAFSKGAQAASGRVVVPLPNAPTDYEYNASMLQHAEFVTANCFYLRDALVQVNGFDERFTAAWREDSDLFFTFLKHGFTCVYTPEAIVVHPVRPEGWGISIRQQRKSMFNALLYKKHPELYRQRVQATPPWRYYQILGALLLMVIGTWRRSRSLVYSGSLIWLLMTGYFCMQRLRPTSHTPRHIAEMIVTSFLIPPLAVFWRLRGMIKFRVFFL